MNISYTTDGKALSAWKYCTSKNMGERRVTNEVIHSCSYLDKYDLKICFLIRENVESWKFDEHGLYGRIWYTREGKTWTSINQ